MKGLKNLTAKEYDTIYNALNQRKVYALEGMEKYKCLDNAWHKEEYERCNELMKMLEPLVFDEEMQEYIEINRERNEIEFKQIVLYGEV